MIDPMILLAIAAVSLAACLKTKSALIKRFAPEGTTKEAASNAARQRAARQRQAESLMGRVGDFAPVKPADSEGLRDKLARAGIHMEPSVWRGIQIICIATGFLLGIAMLAQGADAGHILFAIVFVALGAGGPSLTLISLARDRQAKIASSMATTLELLSITVRSGYPLERGMRLVATTSQGPLADEFKQVDADMNLLGMSLERALKRMDNRCKIPAVSSFCTSLIQAAKQGTSISRVLDAQARLARNEHYAVMQERVNKLPAKLVAPIFGIMMLIIVIALVPPIYETVLVFAGQAQDAGVGQVSATGIIS